MTSYEYFTRLIFRDQLRSRKKLEKDWKLKILKVYLISDFFKALVFLPFEARKQRLQLCQDSYDNRLFLKNLIRASPIYLTKELLFRFLTIGSYLAFCHISFEIKLKYSYEEIRNFIKDAEKRGKRFDRASFYEIEYFPITSFGAVFPILLTSNILATILTQPLDVVNTKLLTQTDDTYRSALGAFRTINMQDGNRKLFLSGLVPRMSFNMLSSMAAIVFISSFNSVLLSNFNV